MFVLNLSETTMNPSLSGLAPKSQLELGHGRTMEHYR